MEFYIDPTRENDEHALPDAEVFWACTGELDECLEYLEEGETSLQGFYYWPCFPGCLPDGDPVGPFDTDRMNDESEADRVWRSNNTIDRMRGE